MTQTRPRVDPKTVLGSGKLQDLMIRAFQRDVDLVIVDQDLTPTQARNLAERLELRVIDRTQRALVSMRRINEILAVEPDIQDRSLPPAGERQIEGRIEFRDLSFAYGDEEVLHHIDLEIPQGTTQGIIGRVGAGKTTLARLIPRLIQTDSGQLLIDDPILSAQPRLQISFGYNAPVVTSPCFGVLLSWQPSQERFG